MSISARWPLNYEQQCSFTTLESTVFTRNRTEANRCDGVVVRASAAQSVDLGFNPLFKSYRKILKNVVYSFPAWRSEFMGGCGEQADKFTCCVLGQGT